MQAVGAVSIIRPSPDDPVKLRRTDAQAVRILATSDLHMHLTDEDQERATQRAGPCLARLSTPIAQAREDARNSGALTLLFDNGDFAQGTPLDQIAATSLTDAHPMMLAFEALGYDATGLGNHDFDFGLDALSRMIAQVDFPVICSNARLIQGIQPWQSSAVLARRLPTGNILNIGVISVLPQETLIWNPKHMGGMVEIDDMVLSARRQAEQLKSTGCDLVVCLAHTGRASPGAPATGENRADEIARIPEIDAVVAGHTHQVIPETIMEYEYDNAQTRTAPIVMPGFGGSHLGLIDLDLVRHDQSRWQTRRGRSSTLQANLEHSPTQDFSKFAAPTRIAARRALDKQVGHTSADLHSYFTCFYRDRALALVAAAQHHEAQRRVAGTRWQGHPILSAVSPMRAGGRGGPDYYCDIPAGPLTQRDLQTLVPFPNTLRLIEMTGADIADWVLHSAKRYNRIPQGSCGTSLLSPEFPPHSFDFIFGIEYEIDLSKSASDPAGRIRHLRHGRRHIEPDDRFVVALSCYRANGGGGVAAVEGASPILDTEIPIRDVLSAYLRDVPHPQTGPWPLSFAAMPGTAVTVQTGPGARCYLHEVQHLGIVETGEDETGFIILRLPL